MNGVIKLFPWRKEHKLWCNNFFCPDTFILGKPKVVTFADTIKITVALIEATLKNLRVKRTTIYVLKCILYVSLFKMYLYLCYNERHTEERGPWTQDVYRWDPGTRYPVPGTQDPKMCRYDTVPGTHKMGPGTRDTKIFRCTKTWDPKNETRDFQFSLVLIVYSTLNTSHFTC